MKNILKILLLSSIFTNISFASCITPEEYNNISQGLIFEKDDPLSSVPNIVNCEKGFPQALSKLSCNDIKLISALRILAIGEIYAYENATGTPVENYQMYNNNLVKRLETLVSNEKNKTTALRKLCYFIKARAIDDYGDDQSYFVPPQINEMLSSKENESGIIIYTLHRIIYLGKSCDVKTLDGDTGRWYKKSGKFAIQLDNKEHLKIAPKPIIFNLDEKVAKAMEKLNCVN